MNKAKPIPYGLKRKSKARLAAVQVLYSHDIAQDSKEPAHLILEVIQYYSENDGKRITPDEAFLKKLVYGVIEKTPEIDALLQDYLSEGWDLQRIGGVMRALLRVAVYEVLESPKLSLNTIINEYVSLSRGFFNSQETGFVNGILNRIGHKLRPPSAPSE